ncbi:MAG: hypothetical protein M3Y35_05505, partial [Actinomycetota bacterium]|nr:hypothetical protein [Actinomycetota bacterium]
TDTGRVFSGPPPPPQDRTTPAAAGPVPSARILRAALAVQLALFAAQLIIGIVVNLYVKVPDVHPGSASGSPTTGYLGDLGAVLAWALTAGPVPLTLHVVLAIVLIVIGLGLVPLARHGGPAQIILTTLAAACTIGAAFNGGSFLIFGNNDNLSSLIMESLSTAAAACYVTVLVRAATAAVT